LASLRHRGYPLHNADYHIEQDFFDWIQKNIDNPSDYQKNIANRVTYLPIFWTRLYRKYGVERAKSMIDSYIQSLDSSKKYLTIVQHDDGTLFDIPNCITYWACKKNMDGFNAPLLSTEHRYPFPRPSKKYLASFLGRVETHRIRGDLFRAVKSKKYIYFQDANYGVLWFVYQTLRSYACLAPRGYCGGSYRFYEAMQLGVVPVLIGDIDIRPFKKAIDWDLCSFHFKDPYLAVEEIEKISPIALIEMGKNAQKIWYEELANQAWCKHLVDDLGEQILKS
jgi:hypothetical protein